MNAVARTARACKKWVGKFLIFIKKCLLFWHKYALGEIFSVLKDAIVNMYKHWRLARDLHVKHKQLTKEISKNLLTNKPNDAELNENLQLTDSLIVHNVAVINRFIWGALFLCLLIFCLFVRRRSTEVPVSIDVRVSAAAWQIANDASDNFYTDWNMAARDTNTFKSGVSVDTDNPTEQELVLKPCSKNSLIEVHQLGLPDKCRMGISLIDSLNANIYYVWKDSLRIPPPTVQWGIGFQDMKISYAGKTSDNGCSNHQLVTLYKKLKRSQFYILPKQGIRSWRLDRPIRVSDVTFNSDPGLPQSSPSIISGKVNLLDIKDRDSVIVLNEGDRLRVNFKEPVNIYLSTEPGYIRVKTQGIVTKLECGPEALGVSINKMPRLLKKITDESPYLLTLMGIILPLLITMLIRQKKSI